MSVGKVMREVETVVNENNKKGSKKGDRAIKVSKIGKEAKKKETGKLELMRVNES